MNVTATITENPKDAEAPEATKPFWVKCSNAVCGYCWPAAHWPMEVSLFVKVAKASKYCPKCGTGKPVVANQVDGKLIEDVKP